MAIRASYDEAFGPSNPHTLTYHEDHSWSEPVWDDEVLALVSEIIPDPVRAAALAKLVA